mgnify:CR=1 FL=1
MKIEIKIDESCTEPKIVIVTDRVTDKINEIIKKLSVEPSEVLAGFRDEQVTVLEPNEIDRIYASGGKVYAETKNGAFLLRLRLYEAGFRRAVRTIRAKSLSFSFLPPHIPNNCLILATKRLET